MQVGQDGVSSALGSALHRRSLVSTKICNRPVGRTTMAAMNAAATNRSIGVNRYVIRFFFDRSAPVTFGLQDRADLAQVPVRLHRRPLIKSASRILFSLECSEKLL